MPDELADAYRFAEGVVTASGEEDALRRLVEVSIPQTGRPAPR